ADRAVGARHGIRTADDADDEVALLEAAGGAGVEHAAERLVPEHEPGLAERGPSVLALHDLAVGPADPDRDRLDEDRAVADVGLGHVLEPRRPRLLRLERDRLHRFLFAAPPEGEAVRSRTNAAFFPPSRRAAASSLSNSSTRVPASPVQPVWWLAPTPAPLS